MKDIFKRTLTGLVFILLILSGSLIHQYVFLLVFLSAQIFTQIEFYGVIKSAGFKPGLILGTICGVLLFLVFFGAASGILPQKSWLVLILFPVTIFGIETFRKNGDFFQNAGITICGFMYVALPFSLLNFLVFSNLSGTTQFQPQLLTGIFLVIWTYDSLAYVFGTLLGKHKIAVKISPHKSWEGLIGGGVFAVIMGILNAVIFQNQSMFTWIITALIIITFGTVGDFFESKLKRSLNVKDSGKVLPGHGGLLDRFDSFLFAIPAVFFWISIQTLIL